MRKQVERLVLGCLLLLLAGCGGSFVPPGPISRPAAFTEPRVSWAQGHTIHYGSRTLPVSGFVDRLWRTDYGFVVSTTSRPRVAHGDHRDSSTFLVDERGSTPLPADIWSGPTISPDGRYLGLTTYDPEQGERAQVVVLDLRTGHRVFSSYNGMGSKDDPIPELYEAGEPSFTGFDEHYAYWRGVTGDIAERRARIGTWRVEPAKVRDATRHLVPLGRTTDALLGWQTGMDADGTPSPTGTGNAGFVSPNGHWCVTFGVYQPPRIVDCRSGTDVTPAFPARNVHFGTWLGPDSFFVSAADFGDLPAKAPSEDHSRGVLARCSLRTIECHPVVRTRKIQSVIMANGLDRYTDATW